MYGLATYLDADGASDPQRRAILELLSGGERSFTGAIVNNGTVQLSNSVNAGGSSVRSFDNGGTIALGTNARIDVSLGSQTSNVFLQHGTVTGEFTDDDSPVVFVRAEDTDLGRRLMAGGGGLHVAGRLKADDWMGRQGVQLEIEDAADPRANS